MTSFQKVFELHSSTDSEASIQRISEGVSIRGYNMWLLFCSATLASIGLDTNSTAVIIGAMLISPLMSPILGIGLSLGIHDKQLLSRSAKNLTAAVILSLIASILYFSISPFGNPTSEIIARTYPTLLDVLVALFGGIAGIVSTSRNNTSIALPGVAIATALMPPLCTAGYGLATQQWNYFGGAFYLFFINAVFISLATFIIVKYLRFPEKHYRTKRQQYLSNLGFTTLIIIVTIPSIHFLSTVYKKEMINKEIKNVVLGRIKEQGNEILKWDLETHDTLTYIKVFHSGKPLNDSIKNLIADDLRRDGIEHYIVMPQRVNMTKEEVNDLSEEAIRSMFQQVRLEHQKEQEEQANDTIAAKQIGAEIMIAFPFVDTAYNGFYTAPDTTGKVVRVPVVFYQSSRAMTSAQYQQVNRFLKLRFSADTVLLIKR